MKKLVISLMALLVGVEANAAGVRGAASSGRYMSTQGSNYHLPQNVPSVGSAGTVNTTKPGATTSSGTANNTTNSTTTSQTNTSNTTSSDKTATTETTDVVATEESDIDQEYVDEIKARYNSSLNKAKAVCPTISENLNKIKTMAGITTGASGVGVLGGGAAAVSGFMKSSNDEKWVSEDDYKKIMAKEGYKDDKGQGANISIPEVTSLVNKVTPDYDDMVKKSATLGTVRTVGSFAAGGADAIGATTSFIALSQFDDLVNAMDECSAAVSEVEKEKNELAYAFPDDPMVAKMNGLIDGCSGLDSKNISDIKGKLTASGAIVAVSAATGIAGGITSMKKMDNVSNILAVATTAGSLAGVITSAMTLSSLNKNGEIADSCQELF